MAQQSSRKVTSKGTSVVRQADTASSGEWGPFLTCIGKQLGDNIKPLKLK